jgi:hypothetical protein
MNYNVLTSFNEKYWNEIGETTIFQLDTNWDDNSSIFLYHELNPIPKNNLSAKISWIDLYSTCPDLPKFVEKWKDHPKANGAKNYRTNAVKFVHKTFAIWHRAKIQKTGWLIWLDVDAFVYKKIDDQFLRRVCPQDKMISYMGRPGKFSECGWIGFNLDHPETINFIHEWEDLYLSGDFINLKETHDSFTFDHIRIKWNRPELFFNINSQAKTNKNPFSQSLIGTNIVHAKGDDKDFLITRFVNRLT